MIREVFASTITAFLKEGELFFRDVSDVLDQHMKRLSALEEEIIYWLAIEREATTLSDLQENIVHPVSKGELQGALQTLVLPEREATMVGVLDIMARVGVARAETTIVGEREGTSGEWTGSVCRVNLACRGCVPPRPARERGLEAGSGVGREVGLGVSRGGG